MVLTGSLWADFVTLENRELRVTVDTEFPRIIKYENTRIGASLAGQRKPVNTVELNGKAEPCNITFEKRGKSSGLYELTFPDAGIIVALSVTAGRENVVLQVTKVKEAGDVKLMSFAFPGNCLLSIDSSDPDATIAATVSTNLGSHIGVSREVIKPITSMEPSSDTGNYLFMTSGKLAGGIASNDVVDIKRTAWEIVKENSIKVCRGLKPRWQYREIESETVGFPWVKVFITGDRNYDGKANWQDAALVYRSFMPKPYGHKYVRSTVGSQVAMNFASGAQQPFLRILDNIKKIYLATDGIGQEVLIKGFSAEGHDSANTDYSGHYNERAGGLRDLNILLEQAKEYNARVGIHINASEVYPEAHRYKPEILLQDDKGNLKGGWVWLDRAILIDKRKDILTGNIFPALEEMRREMPKLDYVYVDTYWENGWKAWKLAKKLNDMRLPMYTEGNYPLDPWTTWSHWRGGHTSEVMRFIWYNDRDLYANDPILRTGIHKGFMGWQNEGNFHDYIRGVFVNNLPAKYLQHFDLLHHAPGKSAIFIGHQVAKEGDRVTVTRFGKTVMTWTGGGSNSQLFVPWPPVKEDKIYIWDDTGEEVTWYLPHSWKDCSDVYLYKLTDEGRTEETKVPVTDSKVSIRVAKSAPYVLYKKKAPKQKQLAWGQGGLVKDPGFDSHGFSFWNVDKSSSNVNIKNDSRGNSLLVINESNTASVSQEISGLEPGKTYAASVWVLVKSERKASINILPVGVKNAKTFSNYVSRCNVRHGMPNDPRKGSNYQRLKVVFDMPAGCSKVLVSLKAAKGNDNTTVEFDDVRIVETGQS
ncbi:MAG: carbohydrate binding domain-containing protein, partial [Anaerohalosphaera sp.]|nr:carbohydrate binding domain-containing protein [Anaerohalosphaera sp.]